MRITHHLTRRLRAGTILVAVMMALMPFAGTAFGPRSTSAAPDTWAGWGSGTLSAQNLHDLIGQMTVAEEDTFIHGSSDNTSTCGATNLGAWVQGCVGQAGWIPGVARLGIPPLRLDDGPAGSRLGHVATAMPAPIGLTASFDREMAYLFGSKVGKEQRSLNQDVWLAPMMNIVSVPTAGRNFETLGEDPYMSGEFGAQLVKGSQDQGLIAMIKHYVDNDFENGRSSTSVLIDERTQHEVQLQPFEKSVKAGAGAAMCSYNRIADVYACGNDEVQNGIIKGLFGFKGFITSDWGATHTPQDLIHGLDMEQSGSGNLGTPVVNGVANGTNTVARTNDMPAQTAYTAAQWKAALDNAVYRILFEMNNAGLLEGTPYGAQGAGCNPSTTPSGCTPYVPQRSDLQVIQPEMFAAAQQIAEKSATLLKNDGNVLPLTCEDLTTGNGVVLMGPTAISTYTGGGGSAHVVPFDTVPSSYDALVAAAKAKCGDDVKISYVPGYDIDGPIVPSSVLMAPDTAAPYANWTLRAEDAAFANQPGLLRQQIITTQPASGAQPVLYTGADAAADQLDATVNYVGSNGLPASTAWRWTGTLTAPAAGSYSLRIFVANQSAAQLFTDGLTTTQRRFNQGAYPNYFPASMTSSYATQTVANKTHAAEFQDGQRPNYNVTLAAGQQVHLDLRVYAGATKPVRVQFRWVPTTNQADQIAVAAAAASSANKVVDFVWDEGSEGSDRGGNAIANGLALTGYQNDVVSAVVAANPNTAVLLNTGDSVFMPWAGSAKSILEMWYPGQMGGPATANVLLGNVNPGGKLPETFYDGSAPVGQRFPQDTQLAACENNTANYGTASGALPGNPGQCPMYPGIYTTGFNSTNLHNYRTINFSDQPFAGIQGNGIFVGYRWFDKNGYAPLFPFGHGLSYTTFGYSDLKVALAGDGLDVSFKLTNTGAVAGDEVPQVYVGAPSNAPVPMAVRALAGFDRVSLNSGETKSLTLHVGARELSYWDVTTHNWKLALGDRPISVGSSSRDIRLAGSMTSIALPASVQYSDSVKATISPASVDGTKVSGSVEFFVDGVSIGSAPVDADGVATSAGILKNVGAHSLSATFTSSGVLFADSSVGPLALTVTQEDASASYAGQQYVSTSGVNSSSANVNLVASIHDIVDGFPGDIRTATVKFVNREGGATLCSAGAIQLVSPADATSGTASCSWTANIGSADSVQYTVGIVVGGNYLRDASDDDTLVTVSKPLPGSIGGGGHLVNQASAGSKAGGAGLKTNFGFNVKTTKSGANFQGNVNVIVRNGGHTYQIKSNAISSLVTKVGTPTTAGTASFSGKAGITDITNPALPVAVDGNATLQVGLTDKGEPGSNDSIAITLWDKSGKLWFSSNWSGAKTVEQTLGGGNLAIR
ncbi:MAG: glycoside hydrolase family 3 C-terminal domain-containing protein [Kouleothrix sp.]|nr:glycoside hydrolase family 3 C-terminal domain-containing protein [Kouleothrix sp.]